MRTLTCWLGLVMIVASHTSIACAQAGPVAPRRRTLGKPFGLHINEVPRHLAFSRDGARLVSAGNDFLCVHDARTLERVAARRHARRGERRPLSCRVAAFDLDGRLVVESGGLVARGLDPVSLEDSVPVTGHDGDGSGVGALSPDGAWLALASAQGGVIVGDVLGRRWATLATADAGVPSGIAWSSDGLTVAVIVWVGDPLDLQMRVRAWDARTGEQRFDLPAPRFPPFVVGTTQGFAWSDGDGLLVVDSLGREVARWNPPSRACAATTSADGTLLAVALDSGATYVLDRFLTERARLEVPHGVTALAFDRAGRRLAVAEYTNLRVFDLTDPDDRRAGPHRAPIDRLALSPDGRRVASLDGGGSMAVWDLATGTTSATPVTRSVGPGGVGQLGFSTSGELLGTNSHGYEHGRLDRWTCDGAQLPEVMVRLPSGYDYQVGLASSSARFVAGSTELTLFDDTGATLGRAPLPEGTGVGLTALSRDGGLALVGGMGVRVLDLLGGRPPRELAPAPAFAAAVAIAPDGARAAAWLYETQPSPRSRVVVWDVASGAVLAELPEATSVAFSPDGARVAVGLRGAHELRLLDASTGATLRRVVELPGALAPLTFSDDGAWVAWGNSGAVELVELEPR